ncbi:hypothetical protein, partial [Halalkalibacter urbisdiaboli]|uniref:hypothetical protein n=1 Tax=Halalkalibacter urbisdiaboli TaxID=1960589 RepID=UPI001A97E27B
MLQNWFKRVQQLFSTNEKIAEKQHEEPKRTEKDKRAYGFIERDESYSEARVTYQYAKAGKFRFPLIEDNVKDVRAEPKNRPTDRKIHKKREENKSNPNSEGSSEKKPFSNNQFKPTSIPSPIHGFRNQSTQDTKRESSAFSPFHMEDIRAGRKEEVPTKPSENLEEIYKNNLENIEQVPVKEEKQIEPDFVIGKKMQPTYEEKSGANFDEIAASKHVERQVVMWEEAEEAIREETWEEFEEETRGAVQEETREEVEEETQEAVQEETREEVEEKTQEAVQEETWEEFEEEAEEAIQEETWEE